MSNFVLHLIKNRFVDDFRLTATAVDPDLPFLSELKPPLGPERTMGRQPRRPPRPLPTRRWCGHRPLIAAPTPIAHIVEFRDRFLRRRRQSRGKRRPTLIRRISRRPVKASFFFNLIFLNRH